MKTPAARKRPSAKSVDKSVRRHSLTRHALFAAAGGAATALAFPPSGVWPAAILGPALLLSLLFRTSRRGGAVVGFTYGLAFFGTLLSWTLDVHLLAWFGLVPFQASFIALFGLLVAGNSWTRRGIRPPVASALAIGVAWAGVEIVRGRVPMGGFSWGSLGYPFADVPLARDVAAIFGMHAIAAIAVLLAALVARGGIERGGPPRLDRALIVTVASVVVLLAVAPFAPRPQVIGSFDVAVVQGNVPREHFAIGRDGRRGPEDIIVVENHLEATEQLVGQDPPDLVVWPENAFDRDPLAWTELAERTQQMIDRVGAPFIVGAIAEGLDGLEYNSNLLWEPELGIVDRYDKHHLVPFGEYVPWDVFRRLVPDLQYYLPTDLAPGDRPAVIDVGNVTVGQAICFESTYPRDVRRAIAAEAEILLVSTNNATFGESSASAQHIQASQMRALEHRIHVVHAGISGISGIIDADGRVSQATNLFEQTVIRDDLPLIAGRTIYARIGFPLEGAAAAFALVMLFGALLPGRLRRRLGDKAVPRPPLEHIVVAIPTYNEASTIEAAVAAVRQALPSATVLVVDDGSPDGTGGIVDRIATKDPQVEVLHRDGKRGLASAYLDAFRWAIERGISAVVEMDADGSHTAADLPRLVDAAADADVVIGSRYVEGGGTEGWSALRRLLSRGGNRYARVWLGLEVQDSTAGFRLYRRPVLDAIGLKRVRSEGYAFQVEMTLRAVHAGATVLEVPITFRERRAGASKMSRRIVFEALWRIPLLAAARHPKPAPPT